MNSIAGFTCPDWYMYRLPGENIIIKGEGECVEGIKPDSFTFSPFIAAHPGCLRSIKSTRCRTVPLGDKEYKPYHTKDKIQADPGKTEFQKYAEAIKEIQAYLKQNNPGGKVVFSRRIAGNYPIDIEKTFQSLCLSFPAAFVFCFNTKEYGCWIGASPELLLKMENNVVSTMALAGTRPSDTPESTLWDSKNMEEQQIVSDYISKMLKEAGLTPELGVRYTRKAGPVEHLCTEITASLQEGGSEHFDIPVFLCRYSPTPALCGSASRKEVPLIDRLESSPRMLYGGWCGPTYKDGFSYFVNLRSAKIDNNQIPTIFSGGGITLKSDARAEWEETERKASTLLLNFNKF